jgi:hypothetical protein
MMQAPFCPTYSDLPDDLPIFPLEGVLLLPRGQLPLNIFEPRYLSMIDTALATTHRLIGMIQPRTDGTLYDVGCAGRITTFDETADGRYLVSLSGIIRFRVVRELEQKNGFRRVQPDWTQYERDMNAGATLDLDREKLLSLLENFFDQHGLSCDWSVVKDTPDDRLMTCLSMVCPFEAGEKQALLEAGCCGERARLFMTMLEIAAARCPEKTKPPLDTKH